MNRTAPYVVRSLAIAALALSATPAFATFHLMQIEQVIGGIDGDTSVQAIQLRSRGPIENQLQLARLRAVDATGANPIVVSDPTTPVVNGGAGAHILIATANFGAHTSPAIVPDFTLTTPIPASYLAAGSLTFEDNTGATVYWRLSWGGSGYTGPTEGAPVNDADGQFGPAWPGALPSGTALSLKFQGAATALSTNNAADYALTATPTVLTNNAGNSFNVLSTATAVPYVTSPATLLVGDPHVAPNPFTTSTRIELQLSRPSDAKLVILDTLGRRLGEVARSLPAGTSSLSWNGRDATGSMLPSGVYFYRLTVGGAVKSGQMRLVR
ncbi:MAG: FlgD immunoglobulin-like domain containing protein [bacterium]